MNLTGLTEEQVQSRIKQGKVNKSPKTTRNTITRIILKNTLTIFNLVNLILALMIISVGAYKNLLFILVAIANTLISIINGIRAKKTVDKMRLLAEKRPTVIRDGKQRQIDQDQIVEGDLLIFSLGDQVIYLYSGSDEQYMKDYNAQYLIQWHMIKYATKHKFKTYNFYGIQGLPDKASKDYGIYDFKKGFTSEDTGRVVELIGAYELPVNQLFYQIHRLLSKLKH